MVYVHRVICIAVHGDAPTAAHEVAHSCGNSLCCNPAHVRWATAAENLLDRLQHGTLSTLSVAQIFEIREARSAPATELAERYGVDPSAIHGIRSGRKWRWLDETDARRAINRKYG